MILKASSIIKVLHFTYKSILNFALPLYCPSCSENTSSADSLCHKCWKQLNFIDEQVCRLCGYPLQIEYEETQALCGRCVTDKVFYDKALSVVVYKTITIDLIHDFKYNDQTYIAKYITPYLLKLTKKLPVIDIITCVPIDDEVLLYRKYNQTAILGKWLYSSLKKENKNIIFLPQLLQKVKVTAKQHTLSREKRLKNLINAFKINPKYVNLIAGKNILLIDDVITTGATINECAKTLKKAKECSIFPISFARSILE